MQVTLLGSGDAVGVPAPLCECVYCTESDRRRRPGVLVQTGTTTLLLDASPDIIEQLRRVGVTELDGIAVTHAHYDHYGGVHELHHAAYEQHLVDESEHDRTTYPKELTLYGSEAVHQYTCHTYGHLLSRLDFERVPDGESFEVGDLTVTPFRVEHGEPACPTRGFVVDDGAAALGYAPDVTELDPDALPTETFDLDLLFVEGSVAYPHAGPHARPEDLWPAVRRLNANQVVATNVSEHLAELHTDALRDQAPCEVWDDFDEVRL